MLMLVVHKFRRDQKLQSSFALPKDVPEPKVLIVFFPFSWGPEWDWADFRAGQDAPAGGPGRGHHQSPLTTGEDLPRPHHRLREDHLS